MRKRYPAEFSHKGAHKHDMGCHVSLGDTISREAPAKAMAKRHDAGKAL